MRAAAPSDHVKVSVSVAVEPSVAFRTFTEEIDLWWRRGLRFRVAGKNRGIIHLEPRLGGRLFESFDTNAGTRVFETGKVCQGCHRLRLRSPARPWPLRRPQSD
jgi:hypothetical protein